MLDAIVWAEVVSTIFYTALGLILLWGSWKVIQLMSPFSIIKEIEEDQNTSLAVLIASVFISMSIIIAAVILS
ncbi:DUF350 domain-containing protein [Maritalea mobilis]|uniref:DUF350 domain-containing protein n=1 Tax=[Roseibacterium] beibuensis TaxID=1193142 RepID=A0ABP9KV89_9RHOB|nr:MULTISPECIES: DUF350 domain-containing protein [Alphaproteobacteria]MBY6201380.1 DUF350 domain-containing protein [Maritalea mobilis]MCS6622436.1 DUF350 domain-containing protein [Roseibacterium beibuensis]